MAAGKLLCLALVLVGANAAKTGVSPVQKVVQLIEDFKAKTVAEGKAAEDAFAEYARWCDDEASAKDRAITETNDEIADLQATIADCEGTATVLDSKISEITTTISATEKEYDAAKSNRADGHKVFQEAEGELTGTVSTLGHDYELIKKEMGGASFAQLSTAKKSKLEAMVSSMKTLVESAWVTTQDKKGIQVFLQQKAQEDDSDSQEPATYESKSGGILDTISDMEEKAEGSLEGEQKGEMKDLNAFALLKMALENELKNLKSELAGAASQKQTTLQEMAAAKKSLEAASKSLAEDQAYLRDLKHECQAKAGEFEVEYKDRATEVAVLGKAKGILTEKFSFIQTSATLRMSSKSRVALTDDRKEQALKLIHKLGKTLGSTVLISLSYRALADPFAKVKGMIEEMIEKLLQEAAEEAEGKAFCDKELGETNAGISNKNEKLDKVSARIEKAESTVEKLTEEMAMLSQELAENDKAMAAATAIRGDERSAFEAAAKDYAESQEACAAAIEVLRGYYESGSFIQLKMKTQSKAKAKAREEESTGDGSAIIGLLEVAESDFSKLLSEAKAAEEAAQDEFNKMSNDSKVLKATKSAEAKGKKTQIASIKDGLMEFSSDKDGLSKELGALNAYLDKLKPQCTVQVPSYVERKQRREKEIDGLKEALSVLEGENIA